MRDSVLTIDVVSFDLESVPNEGHRGSNHETDFLEGATK